MLEDKSFNYLIESATSYTNGIIFATKLKIDSYLYFSKNLSD